MTATTHVRRPDSPGAGSLIREQLLRLLAVNGRRAHEIEYAMKHTTVGMRYSAFVVRQHIAGLVAEGAVVADGQGRDAVYVASPRDQLDPLSTLPAHARGTYVPPLAPPRRPNSDWRCFPSVVGSKLIPYRPHV